MLRRTIGTLALFMASLAWSQEIPSGQADPFQAPPEMVAFVRRVIMPHDTITRSLQALLNAIFRPVDQGGLGMEYDNGQTRTVAEVWRDRKANCLSLTAFYVEACRSAKIEVKYAEATNTNRWRRVGGMVRFERHVVALIPIPPQDDLVADFLPQVRRRVGAYFVRVLLPMDFKALFFANRSVECLDEGNMSDAMAFAELAVKTSPQVGACWNILGVMQKTQGDLDKAEISFKKALSIEPADFVAIGNLEGLMKAQNRFAETAFYRRKGLELRQKDPYFQSFLADEALTEGNVAEAEKRIQAAIRIHPNEPEFFLFLARLKMEKGDLGAASKALEKATKAANPAERQRFENKLEALKRQQEAEGQGKK